MEWARDTFLKKTGTKISQTTLVKMLGIYWKNVQNWEKVSIPIPTSVIPALDKLFNSSPDVVPREEYDKVVSALNSATELNKKLTDLLQSRDIKD